jgi:hypothetical protein
MPAQVGSTKYLTTFYGGRVSRLGLFFIWNVFMGSFIVQEITENREIFILFYRTIITTITDLLDSEF